MDFFNFSQTPRPALIEPMLPYSGVLTVPTARRRSRHYSALLDLARGGWPGTRFTYSVNYTNTTKPSVHQVIVDGTAINMTPAKVVNSHETLYEATDTLSPGTHSYRFKFADAGNSWQLPVNNVPFSGPQVAPFDLTT